MQTYVQEKHIAFFFTLLKDLHSYLRQIGMDKIVFQIRYCKEITIQKGKHNFNTFS